MIASQPITQISVQTAAVPASSQQRLFTMTRECLFGLLRMPGNVKDNSAQMVVAEETMIQSHHGSSHAGFHCQFLLSNIGISA